MILIVFKCIGTFQVTCLDQIISIKLFKIVYNGFDWLYLWYTKHWDVKKREANQKQHASRQVRLKALISAEAKKLLYQKNF